MNKSDNWGSEEQKVLITKAFKFIDIISVDKKDATSLKRKKWVWDRIAGFVNEVNLTGSKRSGKDASAKWQQLKCKARGNLEVLKNHIKNDDDRYIYIYIYINLNIIIVLLYNNKNSIIL